MTQKHVSNSKPQESAAPPLTVDQHFAVLLALLQDEPQSVVERASAGFNMRLQRRWQERRKQGIPTRPMTEDEADWDRVERKFTKAVFGGSHRTAKGRKARGPR
jgi:hypothetical protein